MGFFHWGGYRATDVIITGPHSQHTSGGSPLLLIFLSVTLSQPATSQEKKFYMFLTHTHTHTQTPTHSQQYTHSHTLSLSIYLAQSQPHSKQRSLHTHTHPFFHTAHAIVLYLLGTAAMFPWQPGACSTNEPVSM